MRIIITGLVGGLLGLTAVACDGREAYQDEMQELREDRGRLREAYQEESSEIRREKQHIDREIREQSVASDDSIDETTQEAIMNGTSQD